MTNNYPRSRDLQQSHQIKNYSSLQKSRIPILNCKIPLFDWLTWVNKPKQKPYLGTHLLLSSLTLVADCLHGVLWLCDIPHVRCHWSMKVCQPSKRLGLFRLNVNPPKKIQVLVQ